MPITRSSPRIHYDLYGTGGPDVVLVMGFGMRGAIWKPQTDDLSRDHRLVTMDHRGLGASPEPARFPLSMATLAADVLAVIDEVGMRRPHLVGVSMGGMIAQELAVTHPGRFASVTLIATHPGRSVTTIPQIRSIRNLALSFFGDAEQRKNSFFELLYTDEFIATSDERVLLERARAQLGSRPPLSTLAAQLSAILGHDTTSRLARLTMPVLLVRPDRDRLVRPVGTDRLARALPRAEVLRFADAAHGITFEKAPALNAELRAFFARA